MTNDDAIHGYPYALGCLEGTIKTVVAYLDTGVITADAAVKVLRQALKDVDGNIKPLNDNMKGNTP